MFFDWVKDFHTRWLNCDFEKLNPLERELFFVAPNGFENSMNPDIQGAMTASILDSMEILEKVGVKEEGKRSRSPKKQKKGRGAGAKPNEDGEFAGVELIDYREENVKILLEITKYYGRDVNVWEMFSLFQTIIKKGKNQDYADCRTTFSD